MAGISVPVEIEHLQIAANGIRFHVAAAGPREAPPILFLHGFPEGWMSWRGVMEALSCPINFRPLQDVGHFVDLESPLRLAAEIRRALEA